MKTATISIICILAENRAIGNNNKLLWNIPADLKRFKKLTLGHPVIMGKNTYKSIGKPLPGRKNIILSRGSEKIEGCSTCTSIDEAIKIAKKYDNEEIFIIGGGQIYSQTIDLVDKLYLTLVEGNYKADTFFPDYSDFKQTVSEIAKESDGYRYKYLELER